MYKIIVEKQCGCFKRSDMEASSVMDSKDDALLKSIEMRDTMNNKFCAKHTFSIKEEDNTFIITMNQQIISHILYDLYFDIITSMNRRNFLACAALTPIFANDLMATTNDIYLLRDEWVLLTSVNSRLKRVKRHVGFANFNLISLHDVLFYARNYSQIGTFTKKEIAFIDKLFYEDPTKIGRAHV